MGDLRLMVEPTRSWADTFTAWLPRVGVALFFIVFAGASKLSSDPRSEWVRIFDRIGVGQWFRYFTGLMQLSGGILLLIPRTVTIGAVMLACTMSGAIVTQIFVLRSPGFAVLPAILLAAIVAVWWTGRVERSLRDSPRADRS